MHHPTTPTEGTMSFTFPDDLADLQVERTFDAEIARRDRHEHHDAHAAKLAAEEHQDSAMRDPERMARQLAAGHLTVTITNTTKGHHRTLRFKPTKRGDAWDGRAWFVKDGEVYVGMAIVDRDSGLLELRRTRGSTTDRAALYAAGLVVAMLDRKVAVDEVRGHSYQLVAASTCGRCNRELTDPESIERGIGPECYGKQTASKRAPAA